MDSTGKWIEYRFSHYTGTIDKQPLEGFFFLSLSPFSIFTEIKLVIDGGGETNR
jgi:hypothetical protein